MISTSKAFLPLCVRNMRNLPRFYMNHIKDMREENLRVKAEEAQNQPLIQ